MITTEAEAREIIAAANKDERSALNSMDAFRRGGDSPPPHYRERAHEARARRKAAAEWLKANTVAETWSPGPVGSWN